MLSGVGDNAGEICLCKYLRPYIFLDVEHITSKDFPFPRAVATRVTKDELDHDAGEKSVQDKLVDDKDFIFSSKLDWV